jgi:hypothetical protein
VGVRILKEERHLTEKRPTQGTRGDHNATKATHARLTGIDVSLVSRKNTRGQARSRERALPGQDL